MDKDRGFEDKEEILSARGLMREVTDVNMKRIRARLAERGVSAGSSTFLRHQACRGKGQGKNP
jgi:hypothetical protein